jgi:hypothetical protein
VDRRLLLAVVVALAALAPACSSTPATKPKPCDGTPGFVYVDVPEGPGAVASLAATGACAPRETPPSCDPLPGGCDAATCECKFILLVTEPAYDADPACHLRATSPAGQAFARDVPIFAPDAGCFEPYAPFVTLTFGDGGVLDASGDDAD